MTNDELEKALTELARLTCLVSENENINRSDIRKLTLSVNNIAKYIEKICDLMGIVSGEDKVRLRRLKRGSESGELKHEI